MAGGVWAQDIARSWVFFRFRVRPFDVNQVEIRLTSCWRSRMSPSELIGFERRMSSAYSMREELEERGRVEIEFMKMLKRSGPRMEPCGTADVTCAALEQMPSRTTFWLLLER